MTDARTRLLIADDEPLIRATMSHELTQIGYRVRSAEDGFSALHELRKEVPDILISDLNMPGMSGFELLSVVRRRFPAVHVIAMSGSFLGDEAPSGVAADGFYQKGSSMGSLLRMMTAVIPMEHRTRPPSSAGAPIWIQRNGNEFSSMPCVTVCCPECLRAFPQALGDTNTPIRETNCVYCRTPIHYAVVPPMERWALLLDEQMHPAKRRLFSAREDQSTENGKSSQDANYL
jgi:CheY-like chemotaxis protein